ncbi:MAG: lipooligosaccharide sialyltransferase [Lachnospiraceae bacterium]|nr:lipooligosaccharide sialyltransferase [Lachnospiraceae bacterium]
MKERAYICHTFYHVYVACLKEFACKRKGDAGEATLILSTMSNDFRSLPERAEHSDIFEEVLIFPEKAETEFEELLPLKQNTHSAIGNLKNRIRFCRRLGELTAPLVPTDLKEYGDIYVFCDSDPIGYYLNAHRIPYHAVEDGLNCIQHFDAARFDNRDHFAIKKWLAERGLIFIQNGYAKYCLDMEVNDISVLPYKHKKYIEVPRRELTDALTEEEKEKLLTLFLADKEKLYRQLEEGKDRKRVLILSEPLCDLATRKKLFRDIIDRYAKDENDPEKPLIMIKQHPRDKADYTEDFADCILLDAGFPMEILNFVKDLVIDKVISVYTVVDSLQFVKEKLVLGHDFMDLYEEPAVHRKNEQIGA